MSHSFHKEIAEVVDSNDEFAWISATSQSSCGGCNANSTCGVGILSKVLGKKRLIFKLPNKVAAKPGDQVVVQVPSSGMFVAALLLYILPLAFMFVAAAGAQQLGFSEGIGVLLGVSGLLLGLLLARLLSHYLKRSTLNQIEIIAVKTPNMVLQIE